MRDTKVTEVPKYKRVKRQLIREIESGTRTPGEPFPSERELIEQFGVSRPTLVRSLQELVREGVPGSQARQGYLRRPQAR